MKIEILTNRIENTLLHLKFVKPHNFCLPANIAIASTGYCMGWTSPVNLKLNTPAESPVGSVTSDQIAWIGSLLTVGAIFGETTPS